MSFAYTPNYTFDGSNTDSSSENYSSGDDVYDTWSIDKIDISGSFLTLHFTNSTTMSTWRGTDRSIQFEHTGSGSKGWEGTFDLTTNDEYSINTTYNYVHYTLSDLVGTTALASLMADDISSNGTGSSVLNINNLG